MCVGLGLASVLTPVKIVKISSYDPYSSDYAYYYGSYRTRAYTTYSIYSRYIDDLQSKGSYIAVFVLALAKCLTLFVAISAFII